MLQTGNNAKRWRPARAGGPLTRHGMPASVTMHKFQSLARLPDLLLGRANWQAFTGLPLYSSVTLRSLPVERHRRLVHPLPSGRAATNSRRLIGSRNQFRRIGYQPGSYVSEVGGRGGGRNSTPRIGTPPAFRDLLISIARTGHSRDLDVQMQAITGIAA